MKLFSLLIALLLPAFSLAAAEYYTAILSGAQNGCYKSEALGNAVLTLRDSRLCINLAYTGLSSKEAASHIHGPAKVGVNSVADVIFTLSGGAVKTPATGDCFTLTNAQEKDLMKGLWYFNVHTAACPNGEIRGQIFPVAM